MFHRLPKASLDRMRVLNERPLLLAARNFLSAEECQRLIAKAEPHVCRQTYDNPAGGARTSHGCVLHNDEVSGLRERFRTLLGLRCSSQLQPVKVSRYEAGQRFDIHTDAIRGDLRDDMPDENDWWADAKRAAHGVPGAPFAGANRIATLFVYLNDVDGGGRTRWRWTKAFPSFYDDPKPSDGRVDLEKGAGDEVAVAPECGLGVVHFPATTPETGGLTDYNAFHEAEPPDAGSTKWVLQQFVWSHPRLDWQRVLDEENWEPRRWRSEDQL